MNIEEKAKAYDEALDRAKAYHRNELAGSRKEMMEYIFPELRESEDEKIRKFLIDYFTSYKIGNVATKLNGYRIDDILAYLEKQKEPENTSASTMAPSCWEVEQKEPHYTKRSALFDKCVENCDPKTVEEVNKRVDDIMNMPELSAFEQALTNFICDWEDDEERWADNFVKKHGKHILDMAREELQKEQKPAEPSDEELQRHQDELYNFKVFAAKQAKEHHISFVHDFEWNNFCAELLSYFNEKRKPAEWSEEDEKDIAHIIRVLDDCYAYGKHDLSKTDHENLVGTLKSIHPQLKSEWSDEDEGELQNAIDALEFLGKKGTYKSESGYDAALKAASWLKLFRLQPKSEWNEDFEEEDLRTRFAFYTYKDEDDVLYLSNVFVEETSRNKGFGTKILAAAEKVAEILDATSIRLKVKQDNPANVWYWKHGYNYMTSEDGYDWLEKNLKYLKPKKSIKWSGDDELMIESLIAYLKGTGQDFISNDMVY